MSLCGSFLQVNDFQVRLRSVTRRMMATVSELSMWQATGIKLGAQQQELEVLLAEAMQRLEVGFHKMQHPCGFVWLHAILWGGPALNPVQGCQGSAKLLLHFNASTAAASRPVHGVQCTGHSHVW